MRMNMNPMMTPQMSIGSHYNMEKVGHGMDGKNLNQQSQFPHPHIHSPSGGGSLRGNFTQNSSPQPSPYIGNGGMGDRGQMTRPSFHLHNQNNGSSPSPSGVGPVTVINSFAGDNSPHSHFPQPQTGVNTQTTNVIHGGHHQSNPNSMASPSMMNHPKVVCQPPPQNSIMPMSHMASPQQQMTVMYQQNTHQGGMGDVHQSTNNTTGYSSLVPTRQFYNTGAEMGSLSNPLVTIPDALKPRYGPSRDEMKDRLAESLASDPSISCLPGFKSTRDNCVASFPYGMQNPIPVVHTQRKMFCGGGSGSGLGLGGHPDNRPITPIRRAHGGMGKQDFAEGKFQSLQRMCPIPNPGSMPSIYPQKPNGTFYQPPAGIQCLDIVNQAAQGHFRRGRNGPWTSMGTPGPSGSTINEAKALKEGYRKELQKQIEQTKIRREEETRREKDVNDHPLGANYALPKTYIPPKCLLSNLPPLEMGMRLGRSDGEFDSQRNNSQQQQQDDESFVSSSIQRAQQQSMGGGQKMSENSSSSNEPSKHSTNFETSQNPWNPPPPLLPVSASPWAMMPPMQPYPMAFPPPFFNPSQPTYPVPFNMSPPRPPLPLTNNTWQGNPNQQSWSEKNGINNKLQQLRPNLVPSTTGTGAPTCNSTQGNTGQGSGSSVPNQSEISQDLDKLIDEPLKQYTWQTSDQLPDPALKTAIYKEELRRQIIQKKRDEEEKAMREREEEEKLERRIHDYDERMRREVQEEQNRMFAKEGLRANRREAVMRSNGDFVGAIDRERREREAAIRDKTKYQQDPGSPGDDDENPGHLTTEDQFEREVERKINSKPENHKQTLHHIRITSPPLPAVQKRLETQSDSSLLSGGSKKNLNVLSDMLNSLGLETRRVEKAIQRKMMMNR